MTYEGHRKHWADPEAAGPALSTTYLAGMAALRG